MSFANATTGYVVGTNQVAYRTTNSGASWDAVGIVGGVSGEDFLDVHTWGNGTPAIAVGTDGLVYEKTSTRFELQNLGSAATTETLQDVEVLNSGTNVRICGNGGVVLFRDSGTWSQKKSQTSEELYKMAFQSADHGFGIGKSFVIVEYTQ